jgi:hypothetical protein
MKRQGFFQHLKKNFTFIMKIARLYFFILSQSAKSLGVYSMAALAVKGTGTNCNKRLSKILKTFPIASVTLTTC